MNGLLTLTFTLTLTATVCAYTPGAPPPDSFEPPDPRSSKDSRYAIELPDGLRAELVASDPLIADPVAFDWGPDGRLWVVEMRDYPLGMDGQGKPGGRIKVLEDSDGDGRYDQAVTFLRDLPFPTEVKVWREGVLVVAAPEIFFARDTDGDGKADERKTLYRGFSEGNQQHRVNGLRWGLDNWLYLANGGSQGKVQSQINGESVQMGGRDLRIRPDTGQIEPASGRTQWIRSRDDWGNWFGGNNSNPVWHYILKDHYLRRNPHVTSLSPWQHVSVNPGPSRVYPASETLPRFNDPSRANHFTSACSAIIYRDHLLGPSYTDNIFVCEPVHNLVHREVMARDGYSFTSRRAEGETESEFLASRDKWFRPSMVRTGPDGALWVADMYRFVIEHPEWIPEAWQEVLDLRAGDDLGRIYRIVPSDHATRPMPKLSGRSNRELAEILKSPNGPLRDLAHQMLTWREATEVVPTIKRIVRHADRAISRLQALCTLDALNAVDADLLHPLLSAAHPELRRHAIRLSEPMLKKSPGLGNKIASMASDAAPPVRLQAAYSLGEWKHPAAGKALGKLAAEYAHDKYLMAALLSSSVAHTHTILQVLLAEDVSVNHPALKPLLNTAVATKNKEAATLLTDHLRTVCQAKPVLDQFEWLGLILDALDAHSIPFDSFFPKNAAPQVAEIVDTARATLRDDAAALRKRQAAIALIARKPFHQADDLALVSNLLSPQTSLPLQQSAIERLRELTSSRVASHLLDHWDQAGPKTRILIFETLLTRPLWTRSLLEYLEAHPEVASSLEMNHRQQLLQLDSHKLRQRAGRLFGDAVDSDRSSVVDRYKNAIANLERDADRGAKLFTNYCTVCHRLNGEGNPIGPDLTALTRRSDEALLTAIFDPNRTVEAKYVRYRVETQDGRQYNGRITNETGNSITLADINGKLHQLPRSRIARLVRTTHSLMPEGFEEALSPREVADLIAYIRESTSE